MSRISLRFSKNYQKSKYFYDFADTGFFVPSGFVSEIFFFRSRIFTQGTWNLISNFLNFKVCISGLGFLNLDYIISELWVFLWLFLKLWVLFQKLAWYKSDRPNKSKSKVFKFLLVYKYNMLQISRQILQYKIIFCPSLFSFLWV